MIRLKIAQKYNTECKNQVSKGSSLSPFSLLI